jgi:hypothetical protein
MLFHSPNVLRERLTMGVSAHGFLRMAPHSAARERLQMVCAEAFIDVSLDVSWRARVSAGPSAAMPAPPFRRSLGALRLRPRETDLTGARI